MFSSRYGWRAATAAACLSLFLGVGSASRAADPEIDALRKQIYAAKPSERALYAPEEQDLTSMLYAACGR